MSSIPPQQRDIVYCHQCENEWYRDEHGLECPSCHSDFTEIVEADHDPRADAEEDEHFGGQDLHTHQQQGGPYAPDPDEGDIDNLQWEQTGPDRYRLRGTYRTEIPIGPGQGQGQAQAGLPGGLMGLVGNVLQGIAGAQQGQRQGTPGDVRRPASAPGSPPLLGEQQGGAGTPGGTYTRQAQGPGFFYSITTSSNVGPAPGQGHLYPRNANGPQPFQPQPDHIEQMLAQMINNIGAMPGMGGMPGMRGAPPYSPGGFGPHGGAFIIGGGPMGGQGATGGPGMGPFAHLLNLFGPPGGVAGDAVYSQEALDRIITQLMEQHQTGNAPGPASEAAIKSLPARSITREDQSESGKAECSICMDEVPLGGPVTVLPCHHWFHFDCIKAWLGEHDTCPHCRQGIMPRDAEGRAANAPRSPSQPPLHNMMSPENTRVEPGMPGQYPFPRMGSESPTMPRRNSDSAGDGRRSSGPGVFARMRDAFGRGGSGGGGGGTGEGGYGEGRRS